MHDFTLYKQLQSLAINDHSDKNNFIIIELGLALHNTVRRQLSELYSTKHVE